MIELSVIIPTRNRCDLLNLTLMSICNQSFDNAKYEVIVVDNGSTDKTKNVVDSYVSKIPNLVYFYEERPGLHLGRHDGYNLSRSDILVYCDDDIEAFPTWLEAIHQNFKDNATVLVGGRNIPIFEVEPPFWVLERWLNRNNNGFCMPYLSLIDFGSKVKEISPYYVFGCNFSIRKHIVKEAGGFHPDCLPFSSCQYIGDGETHIAKYIEEHGYKVIYDPKASVYHHAPAERLTLDYFCKWAFRDGIDSSYRDLRYMNLKKEQSSIKQRIKNIASIMLGIRSVHLMYDLLYKCEHVTEIDRRLNHARELGYRLHQTMYHEDIKVRNWVHRENYWNSAIPDL